MVPNARFVESKQTSISENVNALVHRAPVCLVRRFDAETRIGIGHTRTKGPATRIAGYRNEIQPRWRVYRKPQLRWNRVLNLQKLSRARRIANIEFTTNIRLAGSRGEHLWPHWYRWVWQKSTLKLLLIWTRCHTARYVCVTVSESGDANRSKILKPSLECITVTSASGGDGKTASISTRPPTQSETIINPTTGVGRLSLHNTGSAHQASNQAHHTEDGIRDREPFVAGTMLCDLIHFHRNCRALERIRKGHTTGTHHVKPRQVKSTDTNTVALKSSAECEPTPHNDEKDVSLC